MGLELGFGLTKGSGWRVCSSPYQHVTVIAQPGVVQGDLLSEVVPDVAERLGKGSFVEPHLGVVFGQGKAAGRGND